MFNFTLVPSTNVVFRTLSFFYGWGARGRRTIYQRGWLPRRRLPSPVISVGNLTSGGTGKTPMVAWLARELRDQGKLVCILSRGYGGRARGVTCLSDGREIFHNPPTVGEEAYWLARTLPWVPVYTAPCRYAAGMAAWQAHRPDFFLLDDGFQHFQLHRDLDMVLLDAAQPFGNGWLLPAGPLREPVSTLALAHVLVLTRFDRERHLDQLRTIRQQFPDKPVLTAAIEPVSARRYPSGELHPLSALQGQPLLAFAGIAQPAVFTRTLTSLGVDLKGFRAFPDHHPFTMPELQSLTNEAKNSGADALITTSKDFARLKEEWEAPLPLWVLEVAAYVDEVDRWRKLVNRNLGEGRGSSAPPPSPKPPPNPLYGVGGGGLGEGAGAAGLWPPPPDQTLPPEAQARIRGLRAVGRRVGDMEEVRRLLVRAPNWLGDAVMSLPVLSGLGRRFPRAALTVLAVPRVAPLFEVHPGVSEVLTYSSGYDKWHFLWRLRGRYDLALALPNSLESALGLWLARIRHRVGYAADARRPFLTLAVTGRRHLADLHMVYYYLGIMRAFGEMDEFNPPHLVLSTEEIQSTKAWLAAQYSNLGEIKFFKRLGERAWERGQGPSAPGLLSQQADPPIYIGLSPGAAYGLAKRWPPERFAALGSLLYREFGAVPVLLGGPEDRPAADLVRKSITIPVLDLVGRTSLRQALGVLAGLKLLITNDSGLMHAAAALGVPLVALFGSTNPITTGPFTDRAAVLHHPLPCSPCLKRTCVADRDYECLKAITVAEVATAARHWLKD